MSLYLSMDILFNYWIIYKYNSNLNDNNMIFFFQVNSLCKKIKKKKKKKIELIIKIIFNIYKNKYNI